MILVDIYYTAIQLVCCVLLFLLAGIAVKLKSCKWKLCYLIPAVVCIVCMALGGIEKLMIPVYIGSAAVIAGFVWENKLLRRAVCTAAAVLTLAGAGMCSIHPYYRMVDYTADFEETFAQMEERYVLTERKGIDWEKLHDKYLPLFEQATEEQDAKLNCLTWIKLCSEFNDGHVCYVSNDEEIENEAVSSCYGRDYGLAILNYSDGRAVAVNVDSSLNELGIHNGTIITAWDGMDPAEAAKKSKGYGIASYPEESNRYFLRSILAAGTGAGEVSFIGDDGEEKTVQLTVIGDYYERGRKALEKLGQGYKASNMAVEALDDNIACLRIKTMLYDSKSSREDDYSDMKRNLKRTVKDLKDQGIKDLVIDLRDNSGGSGTLVMTLAEIFAPEGEHLYCYDGVWDKDNLCYVREGDHFAVGEKNTFKGEDILDGGHIVILVNQNSVSAADHMTAVLGRLDNTTVMGFTKPNCSGQGVTFIDNKTGGVSVSGSLVLNEKGVPMIDSGTDGKSATELDIQIPFDEDALRVIYDEDGDYLLGKAMEYLDECR